MSVLRKNLSYDVELYLQIERKYLFMSLYVRHNEYRVAELTGKIHHYAIIPTGLIRFHIKLMV